MAVGWLAVAAVAAAATWLTLARVAGAPSVWAAFAAGAVCGLAAAPVVRRGWLAGLGAVGLAPTRGGRRR